MSVEEENKAIVRRFEEEVAKGNLDVIDELLSPDFVDRSLMPGQGPTREDYKRSMEEPRRLLSHHGWDPPIGEVKPQGVADSP